LIVGGDGAGPELDRPVGVASTGSSRGRMRSSQRGGHQFALSNRNIRAGTVMRRMIVASMRTLAPSPSAGIFTVTFVESRNAKNTLARMSAAQVMTRAVSLRPFATLVWLSWPASQCSRILEMRKTSWSMESPKTIAKMIIGT
jgi:hypothetical protein